MCGPVQNQAPSVFNRGKHPSSSNLKINIMLYEDYDEVDESAIEYAESWFDWG